MPLPLCVQSCHSPLLPWKTQSSAPNGLQVKNAPRGAAIWLWFRAGAEPWFASFMLAPGPSKLLRPHGSPVSDTFLHKMKWVFYDTLVGKNCLRDVAVSPTWSSLWTPWLGNSSPEAYVIDNLMVTLKNTYNQSSDYSFRRMDHLGRAPGQVTAVISIFFKYLRTST